MKTNSSFLNALISVGGGSLVLTLGRTVTVLIATRFIEANELGVYFILIASAGVITSLAGFGTNISLVKHVVEEDKDEDKLSIISVSVLFFLISFSVIIGLAFLVNKEINYIDIKIEYIFLFLSFSLFFYLNFALQGLKRFSAISIASSVNGLFKILLTVLLIGYYGFGFMGLVWSIILSNILGVLVQITFLFKGTNFSKLVIFDSKKLKSLLRFSAPIYINQIYSNLYDRGYTILIAAMLDPVAVAYYGVATMIPSFINQIRQVFNGVYFPKLCELLKNDDKNRATLLLGYSVSVIFIAIALSSVGFFIYSEEVIKILFSNNYSSVALAVFILLSRSALSFCSAIMGFSLVALGKNSMPLKINIIITTFSFVLSYYLIPYFGYMAVVYVALASSVLGFSINSICLNYSGLTLRLKASMWFSIVSFFMLVLIIIFNMTVFNITVFDITSSDIALFIPYIIGFFTMLAMVALYQSGIHTALRGTLKNA